ncbi:armadillo repeat-containing protein 2 [Neosynchiropus ocellatus]
MEPHPKLPSPFISRRRSLIKTSAEIVSEARQSLRVPHTQRPFTPGDAQRLLFGGTSPRACHDNRPPSTFSLSSQHFNAPDSRPGSGTRLSPLDHKPKLPNLFSGEDPIKAVPRPPTVPMAEKRGLMGARGRLLRAGSLTLLPPVERNIHEKKSPKGHICEGHAEVCSSGPRKQGPRRTASESHIDPPGVDSGVGPATGRRTGDNTSADEEEAIWDSTVAPLLLQLEAAGAAEQSVEVMCSLCDSVHDSLAKGNMLGRKCKRRSSLLRTLFRFIDWDSAKLNLHVAKLCLALSVSGNNLLNICKLVFKISRSESNDRFFQDSSIIGAPPTPVLTLVIASSLAVNSLCPDSLLAVLLSEDVSASGDAVLYAVGTLKFISGNKAILQLLLDKKVLSVAQKLLRSLCQLQENHLTTAGHILVQLTVLLRNLADQPESRPLFVSHTILPELCQVLRRHSQDQDVCTNVSRIFSKLSSYTECRLSLAQTPGCFQLFLELLSKHLQKKDLVVRLLFTLGNLASKSDEARLQIFQCEGCVDTLLRLYDTYQQRANAPADQDVLVKLVCLVANMCIHPDVGPEFGSNGTCVQLLLETLELLSVQENKELLVIVAVTINNLSFYLQRSSVLQQRQLTVCRLMLKLMLSSDMDAVLEATRVYGNLTNEKAARDFIMQNKVHRFLVTLLDSKSPEVCYSASGVLINLALDPPSRASLSQEGAASKLVDCLKDFGAGDWQLSGRVCQALWNLAGCGRSMMLLQSEEKESLLDILSFFCDKQNTAGDEADSHLACWELDFLPVAHKLLQTLQPEQ